MVMQIKHLLLLLLIPQYLGFVTLDTPFLPAGADMSEHTLVAYLNKR